MEMLHGRRPRIRPAAYYRVRKSCRGNHNGHNKFKVNVSAPEINVDIVKEQTDPVCRAKQPPVSNNERIWALPPNVTGSDRGCVQQTSRST